VRPWSLSGCASTALRMTAFELRRWNPLGALGLNGQSLRDDAVDALASWPTDNYRRPVGELELAPQDLGVLLLGLGVFFSKVPLVDRDDQPLAASSTKPATCASWASTPSGGVDEQHRESARSIARTARIR